MPSPPENDPDPDPAPTLWAEGSFALRVRAPGGAVGRVETVGRCYALLGRIAGADVRINDPAVSARHAYLHLDRRGLYVVDLATRSGTRVGPEGRPAGWLGPGGSAEVAGHRVEVVSCRADGSELDWATGGDDDPLADAGSAPLTRVTLYPAREPEAPLVLGSELVFLGRSPSCGVRVEGESASRTHCVLVRSGRGAYIVDLVGRGTWLNGRPLRGGSPLADGDALMIGSAQFEARVEPPWSPGTALATTARPGPPAGVAPGASGVPIQAELLELPPLPPGLLGSEQQAAVLGWMMGILQAGQAEILRQQSEFQRSMAMLVRQLHQDNSALLARHMERVDAINRELAALREEVRRRFGGPEAPRPHAPALPPATPLRVAPHAPPADPTAATSWLLDRVNRLEQENRSTWKDLLGRLNGRARRDS